MSMQGKITLLSFCRKCPYHAAGGNSNKLLTYRFSFVQTAVQDACWSLSSNQATANVKNWHRRRK